MSDIRDDLRTLIGAKAENEVHRTVKEVVFAAPARATLATSLTGSNNDLDFSAVSYGIAGNATTVAYVDPGLPSQTIGVTVTGQAVVVSLATGAGTNEVQTLTVTATGGTYILGFGDQFSHQIPYNATAAFVQAALEAVQTIGSGNVVVTGSAGGPYTITFQGVFAAINVPLLAVDDNALQPLNVRTAVVTVMPGDGTHNEVQKVMLQGATVGTFTITFSGQTTSALAFNASAATVQTALRALSNINGANVNVSLTGSAYTLTFVGSLADANQPQVTVNKAGLSPSAVVVQTTAGVAYAITSTATNVKAAIAALDAADALVTAVNHSGNDGSGVVTAMLATHLAGGTQGYGALPATALVSTSLTGANNDLDFTAVPAGNAGNGITVTYVDPGGTTATLGIVVDVQERAITVNLGRAASAINTTSAAIITAIAANPAAAALVVATNHSTDTGAGIVTAMSTITLTGGASIVSLFKVIGEVMAAVTATPIVTMAGSSAVFKVGSETLSSQFMSNITATAVVKGTVVDKTGVVASGTAPVTAPFAPLVDGDIISLTPSTAGITGGDVMFSCYWTLMTPDSRVIPL